MQKKLLCCEKAKKTQMKTHFLVDCYSWPNKVFLEGYFNEYFLSEMGKSITKEQLGIERPINLNKNMVFINPFGDQIM